MLAVASMMPRRGRLGLLPLGAAAILGTLLLVACGDPPAAASQRTARNSRFSNRRSGLEWQRPQRRLRRGQTEPASPATATSPDAPTFVQVAAGENHSCALQDSGRVQCWGVER